MDKLQELVDERDISNRLSAFCRIIDGRNWESLGEVFAEDVSFDYGSGGDLTGLGRRKDTMSQFLDGCGGTQHLIGSIMIEVAGNSAKSRAYVQARHQKAGDQGGPVFDSNGEYLDQWERRPAGWRIVRRDVAWAIHSGDPGIIGIDVASLA